MEPPLEPPVWLDREPEILWGCTQPEMFIILSAALAMAVPIGIVFALFANIEGLSFAYLGVPLTGGLTYGLVRLGAVWVRLAKRGRPDHYYRLRFHLWLARVGIIRRHFIQTEGHWHLARNPYEVP